MGRRRTLINGFGANWATGRVSVKNARLPSEHDGNSNCRSVVHRLCAIVLVANNPRFEYSRENHCIISYTRFVLRLSPPPFFASLFPLFSRQFLFFHALAGFCLIFLVFQRVPSVTLADSPQTRQEKKD